MELTGKEKKKVLIADDHPVFRQGIASIIGENGNLELIGEAENGLIAIEMIEKYKPDVVILDVDMPILDGIETARLIKERSISVLTIFLTMHGDRSILRSLKSLNVRGYVLKDSALSEIVDCINTVIAGKTFLSPTLNELILENFDKRTDSESFMAISTLTQSEKKVLLLVSESKSNREIAEELFVSIRTVETHRYNVCAKLNLKGTHALFKFAIRNKKTILDNIRI